MTERARRPDALPVELAGESEALSALLLDLASAPERDPVRLEIDVGLPPDESGRSPADRSGEREPRRERGTR
jgi:hypothetical protein